MSKNYKCFEVQAGGKLKPVPLSEVRGIAAIGRIAKKRKGVKGIKGIGSKKSKKRSFF